MKSKTKCLIFSKVKSARTNVAPIILNGDPLPWIDSVKHLGNILDYENSMKKDCILKRGNLIGKVNSLLQEFSYVNPSVMMKIIFSSWNVTVRNVYNTPWTTHRYLIEGVSNNVHPKTMLCSRLIKFLESQKGSVRYLANLVYDDRRTLTDKNCRRL